MRHLTRILAVIGALGILLLALPSIIIGFEGGFREREVLNRTEPGLNLRITVRKRMAFPANERVDPSVKLRIELRELSTGKILDQARVKLFEDSQYKTPSIQWSSNSVLVSNFNTKDQRQITLRAAR